MRAAAVAVLLALSGVLASEPALAGKGGGGKGGGMWGGGKGGGTWGGGKSVARPQAGSHPHGGGHRHLGHHHHHKTFVGVGVGFGYPWGWWYPSPYYYYPYPVAYPVQPVTYIEQGGAPAALEPAGWWYYCDASTSYYPYVRECPAGWQRVPTSPE
jgi:hypothetical protein